MLSGDLIASLPFVKFFSGVLHFMSDIILVLLFLNKGGVGCSINCRCEGCKNTFGRKDGEFDMDFDHTYLSSMLPLII